MHQTPTRHSPRGAAGSAARRRSVPSLRALVLSVLALPALGAPTRALGAQEVRLRNTEPAVQRALAQAQQLQAWTLEQQVSICEIPAPPFTKGKGLPRLRAHWVRPELVVQVAFMEWTTHDKLRHPRLVGVRTDKTARDVVREAP